MSDIFSHAKAIIGSFTPLKVDCGMLCDKACCCGEEDEGMLLFPGEKTNLRVLRAGEHRLAVCSGTCKRTERPLACMFFPFFPCIDKRGRVHARIDSRAMNICPLAANGKDVEFNARFVRRVVRAGEILARDERCARFMREVTEQIEQLDKFYN